MYHVKLNTIAFLLIFSSFLQGQVNLSGIIYNHNTSEPIEAANIFIAHTRIGTISKPDGSFELSIPVGYSQLIVSHITYKTQTKELSFLKPGDYKQSIRLVPIDIELEDSLFLQRVKKSGVKI